MKVKMLYTLFVMLFVCACADNDIDIVKQEKHPLTAFAVNVGDKLYHGKIDRATGMVVIGGIEQGALIDDVTYTLLNEESTITPDPKTFIGNWKKEQTVTVTTSDGTYNYTIQLKDLNVPENPEEGNVIFFDDFTEEGNPNTDKWVLCRKLTSDWNDEMSESYDQAYVEDGKLVLIGEKVGDTYKAGGIETNGKFSFTFGKVEVRARITNYPNGAFPAIWLMPSRYIYPGWPDCGEIDIMEHIKQETWIHHTIHTNYIDDLGNKTEPQYTSHPECNFADWVVYGMEWTADELKFFVNGEETFSYPNLHLENEAEMMQWPFTSESEFYIILNMGLGGDRPGSWPGAIDDANLPARMEIDWVKVTQPE